MKKFRNAVCAGFAFTFAFLALVCFIVAATQPGSGYYGFQGILMLAGCYVASEGIMTS